MHKLKVMLYGAVCGLQMSGSFGSSVYASGPCFPEVLSSSEMPLYIYSLDRELNYQIGPGYTLPAIDKGSISDKEGDDRKPRLNKDVTIELSSDNKRSGLRHVLKTPLIVHASDGRQFSLRQGTDFSYTLPKTQSAYHVKIPSGTELTKQTEEPPAYKLAKQTQAAIKIPRDYRIAITVDEERIVDRIPETGAIGTTLEIKPKRAPVGEYITLTVRKKSFDFAEAQFRVCLRRQEGDKTLYLPSKSVELEEVHVDQAVLRVRIPDIDKKAFHQAQPVDLLVVARGPGDNIAEVMSKELFVSSRPLAIVSWITAIAIPWVLAGFVTGRKDKVKPSCFNPIWFVSGKYGNASLSLAQILLWTILVFSASFYVLVVSGTLLELTDQVLVLLGIAGGSSIIAKITASARDDRGREIVTPGVKSPKWIDLFQTEGRPDLYKVQMALFTTMAAFFVTGKIFNTLEFPELPAELLMLIGISNGVYLGAKATSRTIFEKLADKDNELQKAKNHLKQLTAEAEAVDKTYKEAETKKTETENAAKQTKDNYEKETDTAEKAKLHDLHSIEMKAADQATKDFEAAGKEKKKAETSKSAAESAVAELEESLNKLKDEALGQD